MPCGFDDVNYSSCQTDTEFFQSFHSLTPVDLRQPLTFSESNPKYGISLSFPPYIYVDIDYIDIPFTNKSSQIHTYICIQTHTYIQSSLQRLRFSLTPKGSITNVVTITNKEGHHINV